MPYGVAAEEGLDDSPDEVFPDGSLDEAFESVPDEALEDEFASLFGELEDDAGEAEALGGPPTQQPERKVVEVQVLDGPDITNGAFEGDVLDVQASDEPVKQSEDAAYELTPSVPRKNSELNGERNGVGLESPDAPPRTEQLMEGRRKKYPSWLENVSKVDFAGMASGGRLRKLRVNQLKSFLFDRDIPYSGNKTVLVDRVAECIAKEAEEQRV
jgi:hypothetical protein